ncbi:nucleotidyl transferase AbiEii/AbiGii toxin family protein [Candidatus Roizmanbacteria bacterium]|nr:nucleotidyl transferase AbiEii/AbiGii toxin family protein [Candidatus Roizmanbacteria bacterium]
MGKISILTKEQKILLDIITNNNYVASNYYFTGGTALSEYYLHHRYSDDLDFFSRDDIDQQVILGLMTKWGKQSNFRFESRFVEIVYRFKLTFKSGSNYLVDFGHYAYDQLEVSNKKYKLMSINSLRDIASNKLFTINQRTDAKDFVDLYFLLRNHYTLWDLIYSAEKKFKHAGFDVLLLAQDLLKVEDFTSLPRMIKPLTLLQLKQFFRKEAIKLGLQVT